LATCERFAAPCEQCEWLVRTDESTALIVTDDAHPLKGVHGLL
jgi:hypothetical protein